MRKAIMGTWRLTAAESDGKGVFSLNEKYSVYYIFVGDKLTTKETGQPDKEFTYRIDPSKSPKEFDCIRAAKNGKGKEVSRHLPARRRHAQTRFPTRRAQ
jgi:uncharacterized protein (TIGR03067 family)